MSKNKFFWILIIQNQWLAFIKVIAFYHLALIVFLHQGLGYLFFHMGPSDVNRLWLLSLYRMISKFNILAGSIKIVFFVCLLSGLWW